MERQLKDQPRTKIPGRSQQMLPQKPPTKQDLQQAQPQTQLFMHAQRKIRNFIP